MGDSGNNDLKKMHFFLEGKFRCIEIETGEERTRKKSRKKSTRDKMVLLNFIRNTHTIKELG